LNFSEGQFPKHLGNLAPHILAVVLARANIGEVHARMFAAAMGISEDPATGAAAVGLAGFLVAP